MKGAANNSHGALVGFEGGEAEFWFMEDFLPLIKAGRN
jgi:hypothetical protein